MKIAIDNTSIYFCVFKRSAEYFKPALAMHCPGQLGEYMNHLP